MIVGISVYFYFSSPPSQSRSPLPPKFERNGVGEPSRPHEPAKPQKEIGTCGNSICDEFEKKNPDACPADCLAIQSSQPFQSSFRASAPALSSYLNSPFGMLPFFSFSASLREGPPPDPEQFDFKPTKDLGLKWGRAHYLIWAMVQPTKEAVDKEIYDWSDADSVLGSYPEGFNVVENILAFPAQRDERGERLENFSFPNKEAEKDYIRFVQRGVERYDGDGKDDMPGLKNPIKYWQVENEPDLKAKKDWDGYANLLKITYEGVKSVCADCRVLIGGMGGEIRGLKEFFEPAVKKLGGQYFNIFDYHCYSNKNDWEKCGRLAEEIKKSFPNYDFEIWLTETGTWSGSLAYPLGQPSQTEKDQAESIIKFYIYPLSKGVCDISGSKDTGARCKAVGIDNNLAPIIQFNEMRDKRRIRLKPYCDKHTFN